MSAQIVSVDVSVETTYRETAFDVSSAVAGRSGQLHE